MSMGARNILNIRRIRRIVDQLADRLCCHLMETAYVTLYHERGPPVCTILLSVCEDLNQHGLTMQTRSALASIGPRYLSIEPVQIAPVSSPPTSPARATTRRSPQPVNVPASFESTSTTTSPVRRIVHTSPSPPSHQSTPGPSTPIGQVNPSQTPVPITPIRQSALGSPTCDSTPENPAEEFVVQANPPPPPPKALLRPSAPTTRSGEQTSRVQLLPPRPCCSQDYHFRSTSPVRDQARSVCPFNCAAACDIAADPQLPGCRGGCQHVCHCQRCEPSRCSSGLHRVSVEFYSGPPRKLVLTPD